jgi:hypothetical protein
MKAKSRILVFFILALISCNNNEKASEVNGDLVNNPASASHNGKDKIPLMDFEESTHDFGKIYQGEKVSWAFKFKNTGNAPLVISSVVASCGCTVPSYPKKPIAPGEEEYITIVFNSKGLKGNVNKNINIFANTIPNSKMLYIKGFIIVEN